jgi:hypothetical protein
MQYHLNLNNGPRSVAPLAIDERCPLFACQNFPLCVSATLWPNKIKKSKRTQSQIIRKKLKINHLTRILTKTRWKKRTQFHRLLTATGRELAA